MPGSFWSFFGPWEGLFSGPRTVSQKRGGFLRKGGGFICFLDLPKQRRLCKRSRSSSSCHTQTEEPLLSNSRVASVKQVVIAIIEEFSKISNFGDFELFTSTIDNSASIRERGGLKKQNSLEFNPRHDETLFQRTRQL